MLVQQIEAVFELGDVCLCRGTLTGERTVVGVAGVLVIVSSVGASVTIPSELQLMLKLLLMLQLLLVEHRGLKHRAHVRGRRRFR